MKYAEIKNIPENPDELFKEAITKSFNFWIDEKGTKDNPGYCQRRPSKLHYREAFNIIQNNKPHWVILLRNHPENYWEFGGCNISNGDYGEIFIFIQVKTEEAEKIFKKYKLEIDEY